jgi:hypothetical protein
MLRAHFIEHIRALLTYSRLWFYPQFLLRRKLLVGGGLSKLIAISIKNATSLFCYHTVSDLIMNGDDAVDTLAMNQAIEKTIALCPAQYYWSFRLFKTRPPGEASYYE